jgi:hypothetical protein
MRRRELFLLLGGAVTAARALHAQQKAMLVIGYLNGTTPEANAPQLAAFRQGLSETGRVEGQPFVRQQLALGSLEQQIAAGRTAAAEAKSLRQEADRLAGSADFVESERDKAGPPLVVLAAATRVLPDDTYLTEVELQKRKVTLTGRSAAAAR